jgi:AraC family transcriptional regulator
MDWAETLQRAIDYIEAHLEDKLSPEVIAAQAYVSSFHFQRAFHLLTGRTLGEYIRDRRLTLAGQALANSDQRVIDVAYRFGYDSPESFSKAFQRFHGISPALRSCPARRCARWESCPSKSYWKAGSVWITGSSKRTRSTCWR